MSKIEHSTNASVQLQTKEAKISFLSPLHIAASFGSKRSKQGAGYAVAPFFWLAPCPALRSATSSVVDRVTLARLVNMLPRRPLPALAIPSLTCSLLTNPSASAKKATLTCVAFLAEAEGLHPRHDYIMHGGTPLCSALALRRVTTHVSGSPFAPFRASYRSHTKDHCHNVQMSLCKTVTSPHPSCS